MEIFTDWTVSPRVYKGYSMIPKREFNPEISAFSNFLLDLVDFRDRVRPMASDLSRHDAASIYQRGNADDLKAAQDEFREGLTEGAAEASSEAVESVEEGYSSLEIAAESGAEDVDAVESGAESVDAAEPDLEAAAEAAEAAKAAEATAEGTSSTEETEGTTSSDETEEKKE